jgi:hypothetical protein
LFPALCFAFEEGTGTAGGALCFAFEEGTGTAGGAIGRCVGCCSPRHFRIALPRPSPSTHRLAAASALYRKPPSDCLPCTLSTAGWSAELAAPDERPGSFYLTDSFGFLKRKDEKSICGTGQATGMTSDYALASLDMSCGMHLVS